MDEVREYRDYIRAFCGEWVRRTYVESEESAKDVIERHGRFLRAEGISRRDFLSRQTIRGPGGIPPPALAFPMAAAKFHKNPVGWRYIACSSTYTLRPLSIWLSRAFAVLVPVANEMWNTQLREANVFAAAAAQQTFPLCGSWIISDSQQVPQMIRRLNNCVPRDRRQGVRLQTFDFAKMYTNIRLDVLKARLAALIRQLFAFARADSDANRFLRVSKSRSTEAKWVRASSNDTRNAKYFDAVRLSRWFSFLVDNIFFQFSSDLVLRQSIGIPMGTNCAVFVANLFCFSYEFAFLRQLVQRHQWDLLRRFRFTKRFVDDLLACNNPLFFRYAYTSFTDENGIHGIYPPFLRLSCEQDSTGGVSFLDTEVRFDGAHWYTTLYDKREHPPLSQVSLVRYPHPTCFLSDRSKLGIVTSRLFCFSRICMRKKDFIARARLFLSEFVERGYSRASIRRYVQRFLKRVPLFFTVRSPQALTRLLLERRA